MEKMTFYETINVMGSGHGKYLIEGIIVVQCPLKWAYNALFGAEKEDIKIRKPLFLER